MRVFLSTGIGRFPFVRSGAVAWAALAIACLPSTAPAADPDALVAACLPCHGPGGNSVVPTFPKLAGQQESYLAKQIADFVAGKRKSDIMAPVVAGVKSSDVGAIAAWFAGQKQAPGKVENPALAAAGKKLFLDGNEASGVPSCSGCHLENGMGNDRYPRIAGQHQAYAIKEMTDFKTGARANDKGRVMRVVAERLTEAEMKAVAEYMAGL